MLTFDSGLHGQRTLKATIGKVKKIMWDFRDGSI